MPNKTLFILFAPGLGGNHVANMLSTSDEFNTRFNDNDYDDNAINAHHLVARNLNNLMDNIGMLTSSNNVLCAHWANYYWNYTNGQLDTYFPNRQILLITPPKTNSVAYKRLIKYVSAYKNEYFYKEMSVLYTIEMMQKMFNETDFFVLDAETIFQENVEDIVASINEQLCLKVDLTTCQRIHSTWLKNRMAEVV